MKYLILGATGTLGQAMIAELLKSPDTKVVRCLSRDELKLSELRRKFNDPRVVTVIGDIKDKSSILPHFGTIDVVFHFAALKRIPEMEAQPMESLKTNVLGTINAAECALERYVRHFVFSSTDKACLPINTYGASKFLSEQILLSMNKTDRTNHITNFSVYRWGNVLSSRGSVIYAFKDLIENNLPAEITDPRMTRFWMKIEDAVKFILQTYTEQSNKVKLPPLKAAPVLKLLSAIGTVMNKVPAYVVTGMRAGEKLHEDLSYDSETLLKISSDTHDQYTEEELITLAKEILA